MHRRAPARSAPGSPVAAQQDPQGLGLAVAVHEHQRPAVLAGTGPQPVEGRRSAVCRPSRADSRQREPGIAARPDGGHAGHAGRPVVLASRVLDTHTAPPGSRRLPATRRADAHPAARGPSRAGCGSPCWAPAATPSPSRTRGAWSPSSATSSTGCAPAGTGSCSSRRAGSPGAQPEVLAGGGWRPDELARSRRVDAGRGVHARAPRPPARHRPPCARPTPARSTSCTTTPCTTCPCPWPSTLPVADRDDACTPRRRRG